MSLKIGELAEKARCLAVTIRYYEKMGLLPNDKRSAGNQRLYDDVDGERLRFILHCRNHKISIQDTRRLLEIRNGDGPSGQEAASLVKSHIDDLRRQRDSLDALIQSLSALLEGIDGEPVQDSAIISALASPCPHCPDYAEKVRDGIKIDARARFLSPPAKKGG